MPTPTPMFATEEEAFAAAEEVYRAYNDAENALRMGNSDARPTEFLVGSALEGWISANRRLEEAGLQIVGNSQVLTFVVTEETMDGVAAHVMARVCVDGSATRVLDADGVDVTDPERTEIASFRVEYAILDGTLLISSTALEQVGEC